MFKSALALYLLYFLSTVLKTDNEFILTSAESSTDISRLYHNLRNEYENAHSFWQHLERMQSLSNVP